MTLLNLNHIWIVLSICCFHVVRYSVGRGFSWSLWSSYALHHSADQEEEECLFLSKYTFIHHVDKLEACNQRDILATIPTGWIQVVLPAISTVLLLLLTSSIGSSRAVGALNRAVGSTNNFNSTTISCRTVLPYLLYTFALSTGMLSLVDQVRQCCMLVLLYLSLPICSNGRGIFDMLGCKDVLLVICIAVMCFFEAEYFLVLPFIIYLAVTPSPKLEAADFSLKTSTGLQLILVCILVVFVYYSHEEPIDHYIALSGTHSVFVQDLFSLLRHHIHLLHAAFDLHRPHYDVSYGILWYLHALSLPEFAAYFEKLLMLQPLLAFSTIIALLRRKVSTDHILIMLMLLSSQLFVLTPKASDIFLLLWVLWSQAEAVVAQMRYLPIVVLGVLLPFCLSPIIFDLWAIKGSGNANFLFFQGLAFWVFLALFVIEFINTSLRIETVVEVK